MDTKTTTGFNSNQLKMVAIVAMTVDHLASVLAPNYPSDPLLVLLHMVGRITAPIMWFFIAEGFYYTRDLKKYIGRLFGFAVVSHFAYNFAFGIPFIPFQTSVFNQTSVFWSLAWGLVALAISESKSPRLTPWVKLGLILAICLVSFCADWSCIGVMAIVTIGHHRGDFKRQMLGMVFWASMYALVYVLFINPLYGAVQLCVVLSIPLLRRYNGQRGDWRGMKWLFYVYYPAHLFLLGLLRLALHGNVGLMIGG